MNNDYLSQVTPLQAEAELGKNARSEIRRLLWHLNRPTGVSTWDNEPNGSVDMSFRYAPSIIVRSELQVYGVSAPRFAVRLELNDNRGFVNLRRLKHLEEVLLDRYETSKGVFPLPPHENDPQWERVHVSSLAVGDDESVADSIISLPTRFPIVDYHHVAAKLAIDFGEAGPGERNYEGTPYVRTPIFGVGLCAQACCFVSTLLHPQYATHVCGLGEISALVADPEANHLQVAGLSQEQMMQYFQLVNLRAIWQLVEQQTEYGVLNADHFFDECLHAYVASNIPVILCLDVNRLPRRNLGPNYREQPEELAHHAVTVVGCSRWKHLWVATPQGGHQSPKESVFLYHDSSCMPFSNATTRELVRAGMRSESEPLRPSHPSLLPVTPPKVSIPLLNWKIREGEPQRSGLLKASRTSFFKNCILDPKRREFLLAQLHSPTRFRLLRFFTGDSIQPVGECLYELISGAHENLDWDKDGSHWVWFEAGIPQKGSWLPVIKLWDAEVDATLLSDHEHGPGEVLRAVLAKDRHGIWQWEWNHF